MSVKDILVALRPGSADDAALKYAVSMGEKLQAHVTGRVYSLEPELRGMAWLPEDILEGHRGNLLKEGREALKKFKNLAKSAKLDAACELFKATLSDASKNFAESARVHDISVLTQSRPGVEHVGDVFLEAALFHSGRPVVIVPRGYKSQFSVSRVLIAWDGGAQAARAVALSMSLLAPSSKINIVVVGDRDKAQDARAEALQENIRRHGYEARLAVRDSEDATAIAREAKDWRASLLVMGGYGRSRFREVLFGGVTRYMFMKAPLPIFMAH